MEKRVQFMYNTISSHLFPHICLYAYSVWYDYQLILPNTKLPLLTVQDREKKKYLITGLHRKKKHTTEFKKQTTIAIKRFTAL